jgi:hypothetical protein
MSRRTPAALLLILAALASLAWGAREWRRGSEALSDARTHASAAAAELDSTRARLRDARLAKRAFMESASSIPDSLRRSEMGVLVNEQQIHQKRIDLLELTQEGLERRVTRLDAEVAGARRSRTRGALPGAAVAVALLAAGGPVAP